MSKEIARSSSQMKFASLPMSVLCSFAATLVLAIAVVSGEASAGTTTWSGGGGNGNWSTSSNWSTLPTTSGTWSLVFGGTTQTTNTNNIGPITVGSLTFGNNGTAGRNANFTLSGSTLALSSATITTTATTSGSALTDSVGNALSLTGSNTASIGSGHNLTIAGNIGGTGSLTMSGAGQLFLTGSNSQSGTTYITGGSVRTGSGGSSTDSNNYAFGTGNVVVSGSGTLAVRNSSTVSNDLTIGGLGSSASTGSLAGSFAAANQTAVVSGSVTLATDALVSTWGGNAGTGSKLSLTGPINLGANKLTLSQVVTGTAATSIQSSGVIAGTGSVVVDGTANVHLNGASSYSGGTVLQSGTIHTGNSTALGSGVVTLNAGVLDLNGQSLSIGALSGSSGALITSLVSGSASLLSETAVQTTYAGRITDGAGVVSLTKAGSGSLFLTGSNSQSGTTYITGGNVRTGSGGSSTDSNDYAFGTGDVVVSGSGTLAVRNSSTLSNNLTIGGVGSSASTGALAGSFGAANQTAVVSGSVTLSSDAFVSTWASGAGAGSKLSLSGPINVGSNVLTFSQVVTGTSPRSLTDPASWITVGGAISGAGSVVVDGGASVYLNGANTYSGTTTVQSGVLGGNGTIAGAVTVQNGAFLTPGSAANTTGALGVGSLQLDSGATAAMAISGTAAGLYDQVVALGNVNYGGNLAIDFTTASFANFDVWQLFSGSSFSGNFSSVTATGSFGSLTFNDLGTGEWQATGGSLGDGQSLSFYVDNTHAIGDRYRAGQLVLVPEPSTIVFAGIGLFVMGWQRLAKRRRAAQSSVESIAAV
jgi:fibronectin-binding autotransporter adhesin